MAVMTKSQQVERRIRKQIISGKYAPGQQLPPDREMVSKFGVSLMTVREALIKLANDGLLERKQGSGTFVTQAVKKATIGILANVNHITSPNCHFYSDVLGQAKQFIKAAGFKPSLFMAHNQSTETQPADTQLFDKGVVEHVAGVLSLINLSQMENALKEHEIPAVSLPHHFSTHSVVHDFEAMTLQGVELLRKRCSGRLAVMHFDYSHVGYDKALHASITEALGRVGEGVDLIPVPSTPSCEHAYTIFKNLWAGADRPAGIFFHDDGICDVATRAILELGIRVPTELAIVTMSNIGRPFVFPVELTSVSFDTSKSVRTAWSMLSALIDQTPVEQPVVKIPPVVLEGASLR